MSSPGRRDLRERRTRARRTPARSPLVFLAIQALLLDLVVLAGAAAAWPIYRSASFVVLVGVALLAAHAIAYAGMRWRWSGWWVALATIVAYLVLGLPLAAPGTLSSVPDALRGLAGVATAPVTGWKDLLTLELPLGSYQATLAPALLVFLATPVLALSLAWRSPRLWTLAAPVALVPTVFGVAFGSTALAPAWALGPVRIAPEVLVGAAALLASLGATVWRTIHERRRAVAAATAATGVRTTGRSTRSVAGRLATAGSMVLVAVVAGAVAAPWALAGSGREVLRSGIDPRLELASTLSPLAQYRGSFDDDSFDTVLFTVDAPDDVDRVRLATLPFYDGQVARVIDPDAGADDPRTAFVRVPSALPAPASTASGSAAITIGEHPGPWVPTVGAVTSMTFTGADATSLADAFFYNRETQGAVELADPGLEPGVEYRQGTAYDPDAAAVASLTPARSTPALDEALVPESLVAWMDAQSVPGGGEGLVALVERLRARGFLSHALTVDPAAPPAWATDLGDYAFQPSRAGHSTDRIEKLFADLITRQNEIGGDEDAELVAGVGDDEQFAVAAMMIADQLGFDARVVIGTRLASDDETLATCTDGSCTGGDLSAWIEVRGTGNAWTPLDVTPQHAVFPSPDIEQRQDPQIPTDVRGEQAESVLPAEANPSDGGERPDDDTASGQDLTALWTALRIGGISLLALVVVFGPFAVIVLLKLLRRRGRRNAPDPVERFTGGWQEYVDTAVDHGYVAPKSQTRQELAAGFSGDDAAAGVRLATWADRSVFDVAPPSESENDEFWRIVDAERARFAGELGWWARLRARVSLRSLLRRDAPVRPKRRRDDGPAR